MPERSLTLYSFLLYIVPDCPSPPHQPFRVNVMLGYEQPLTEKGDFTCVRCYQLPQFDLLVSQFGKMCIAKTQTL